VVVFYYGTPVEIEFPMAKDNKLQIGYALLSKAGQELALLCGSEPNGKLLEYAVEKWREQKLKVEVRERESPRN
jgi:hypothetical protein